MRTLLIVPVLLLACVGQVLAVEPPAADKPAAQSPTASDPSAWPHEASQLKPDARAVWGKLDNGLRYVILPAREAPGRASLQLVLDTGSAMEADDQQGLAHYLEHMAFNGTKHFAAGETFAYFQRLGMRFGAHTNAQTTFLQTQYQLELPKPNEALTGEGLKLFRDFLDGMLLDEKDIEKERGVILSELLARNTSGYRSTVAGLQFSLPDSLIVKRLPLGQAASVRKLSRAQFVQFYESWYTPRRALIVAVGDFDVAMARRLIEQQFADAKARSSAAATPKFADLRPLDKLTALLHSDPDADSVSVSLVELWPLPGGVDSLERRRHETAIRLGNLILETRLRNLAAAENAVFQSPGVGTAQLLTVANRSVVTASCSHKHWQACLGTLEQELRRAQTHGFSASEFNEVKATLLAARQAVAEQADTEQASSLAAEIIDSISEHRVFVHPADMLALTKEILNTLTQVECEQIWREHWKYQPLKILVQGNLVLEGDAAAQIVAAFMASQQQPVLPTKSTERGKFAYTEFGPAGEVTSRQEHKELGILTAVLANQVRVNIKHTDYEKKVARILIRFGAGTLELPTDKPGLQLFATGAFIGGGLKAHALADINRICSDQNVTVMFNVSDEAFQLGGGCSATALETELQLCTAYLTAPGYRAESRTALLANLESYYAAVEHTPDGVLSNDVFGFIHGDDPRFRLPPQPVMAALTLDDMKQALTPALEHGYMEVSIVGDIDPNAALALVTKTLGALPKRDAAKADYTKQRQVKFPAAPKQKQFEFAAATPRGVSYVAWPTDGSRDAKHERRLGVLVDVLNDRLRVKVRQELGATYTPETQRLGSDSFPQFGYVAAKMLVDPDRASEISELVAKIAVGVAEGSVSDDEFARAINYKLESLKDLDNGYWLTVLCSCQERPEALTDAAERESDYKSITKGDVEKLAQRYLAKGQATVISVKPKSTK